MRKILSFLMAVLFAGSMMATEVTASATISELVEANEWTVSAGSTIGTLATQFALDEVISVSTSGTPNCGSIWGTTPNNDWRLYQNQSGEVTISASSGTIKTVKLTFTVAKSGCLNNAAGGQISSNTAVDVNATTVTFTVGNTGTATNGQVKITAFEVVYETEGGDDPTDPTPAEILQGYADDLKAVIDAAGKWNLNVTDLETYYGQMVQAIQAGDENTINQYIAYAQNLMAQVQKNVITVANSVLEDELGKLITDEIPADKVQACQEAVAAAIQTAALAWDTNESAAYNLSALEGLVFNKIIPEVEAQINQILAGVVDATMTPGTNGSDVVVNGNAAIKVGTSNNAGDMTITVGAGATRLYFYAAAWKGNAGTISVSAPEGVTVSSETLTLIADDGISNSSPFTLASTNVEQFACVLDLENVAEETAITLASGTAKRFVVWGAAYELEGGDVPPVVLTERDQLEAYVAEFTLISTFMKTYGMETQAEQIDGILSEAQNALDNNLESMYSTYIGLAKSAENSFYQEAEKALENEITNLAVDGDAESCSLCAEIINGAVATVQEWPYWSSLETLRANLEQILKDAAAIIEETEGYLNEARQQGSVPQVSLYIDYSVDQSNNWLSMPLSPSSDGTTAAWSGTFAAGLYNFKMIEGGDWYGLDGDGDSQYWFTRENSSASFTGNSSRNMIFMADNDPEDTYTFVWTYATKTLTVEYPAPLLNCAQVYGVEDNEAVKMDYLWVTGISGRYVWVQDQDGALMLYLPKTATYEWEVGDQLIGIAGTKTTYNGTVELSMSQEQINAAVKNGTHSLVPVELAEVTLDDINKLVLLPSVTLAGDQDDAFEAAKKNISFKLGDNTVVVRNEFLKNQEFKVGKKYNIMGIVAYYVTQSASTLQVYFISAEEVEELQEDVYTIVGVADLAGSSWNPGDENNDMVHHEVENIYTLSKTIELCAGTYGYKVVKNHSWDENWPGENAVLVIDEDGLYTVTFTFSPETGGVSADKIRSGDYVCAKTYTYFLVGGEIGWDASDAYQLTLNPDATVEEYMIEYTATENETLKVLGINTTNVNDQIWYKDGLVDSYVVAEAGTYTIYFRPNGNADWGYYYFELVKKEEPVTPNWTIAEFIQNEGGKCYLTGVVSDIKKYNDGSYNKYGNFNLTDESGTIYVYGLLTAEGEAQQFANMGVDENDTLTVLAEEYQLFNSTEEVVNAIYVSHKDYVEPVDPSEDVAFYLVGTILESNWEIAESGRYLFEATDVEGEYWLRETLDGGDECKVRGVDVTGAPNGWYPDGLDNNYIVPGESTQPVEIFFRPKGDGGDGWHYGYIFTLPQIRLDGAFTNWENYIVMNVAADKQSASVTIDIEEPGEYQFVLYVGVDGRSLCGEDEYSLYTLTRDRYWANALTYRCEGVGTNMALNADVAGTYVAHYEYASGNLWFDFPSKEISAYEVAEAIEAQLNDGDEINVRGVIKNMTFKGTNFAKYGSVCIYVEDATGAEGEFEYFNCYSFNEAKFVYSDYDPESTDWISFDEIYDENGNALHVGDTVIAHGAYKLYNNTKHELNTGCYIVDVIHPTFVPDESENVVVYLLNTLNWNEVYAYVWKEWHSLAYEWCIWPGIAMRPIVAMNAPAKDKANKQDDAGKYRVEFPKAYDKIIFSGMEIDTRYQTDDLQVEAGKTFVLGEWNGQVYTGEWVEDATAIGNINTNTVEAVKVLENGQILIIKNGKIFNITGQIVK